MVKSKHEKYVTLSQNDKDVLMRHRLDFDITYRASALNKLNQIAADKRNQSNRNADNAH
ncbi:MAG: hypothetical protein Q8942_08055 [Bacillota bacterium]|nr:hypothetical protein [Bacillota bacterium]